MISGLQLQAFLPLIQGFLLCAGLVMVIGPQNLFVLRQGVQGRHLLLTALLCTVCDLVLIGVAVGGVGEALALNARVLTVTTLGGATFLFGYGVRALRTAWYTPSRATQPWLNSNPLSLKGTILASLTFAFLNPGAYLDTVLMIGTTSSRYPLDERLLFGAGAVLASALWFFTLTYGANRLQALFRHTAAWRTLDLASGMIMVGLALSLSVAHCPWVW